MTTSRPIRSRIVRFALFFALLATAFAAVPANAETTPGYESVLIYADDASIRALAPEIASLPGRLDRAAAVERYREEALDMLDALAGDLRPFVDTGAVRSVRPVWIAGAIAAEVRPGAAAAIEALPRVGRLAFARRAASAPAPDPFDAGARGPVFAPAAAETSWALSRIGATELWAAGLDGTDVIVAILDTGVDGAHPDLAARLWVNTGEVPGNGLDDDGNWYIDDVNGWNFDARSGDVTDEDGHGTYASGLVGGDGTAGTATGAAPGSSLMICKTHATGAPSSDLVCFEAIQYAVENGADVILLGAVPAAADRRGWRETCRAASLLGTAIVAGAGDRRGDATAPVPGNIETPGDIPSPAAQGGGSVITIGSTGKDDALWDPPADTVGSGEGPVSWETVSPYLDHPYPPGLVKPDLAAPGDSLQLTAPGGGYVDSGAGTDWSAALAAGVVALLMQQDPNIRPAGIDSILQSTAVDLGAAGKDTDFGAGFIDAVAASAALAQQVASGHITENTTWYAGDVYLVTGELTIDPGVTLSLEAGVVVKIAAGVSIVVNGVLDPQGNISEPVVFTSWRDDTVGGDTNGDGPSAGEPGDWGAIQINGAGNTIQFCEFHYGGDAASVDAILHLAGGDPLIRYCRIENGYAFGDWILCESNAPAIEHNTIVAHGASPSEHVTAIHAAGGAPEIRFNRIEFSGTFAFIYGILLENTTAGTIAQGNRIDDTSLWNGGSDFIISCANGSGVEISADTIATIYGNGIGCSLGATVTVSNNIVSGGNTGRGLYCRGMTSTIVTGNTVSEFAYGIESDDCSPTITSNAISSSASTGVRYPFVHTRSAWPAYTSNAVSGTCFHAIGVKGVSNGNIVWSDIEGRGWPYVVIDNFAVNTGDTLTVPAGTIIKMANGLSFYLNGRLELGATAADPVIFTSWRDDSVGGDSNGDGYSTGEQGDWGYLRIASGDNIIEYCEFRYGGNTLSYDDYALFVYECDPIIRRCKILEGKENNSFAVYIENAAPTIEDCTIQTTPSVSANGTGIYCIHDDGQPLFTGNTIAGYRAGVYINATGAGGTQPRVTGNTIDCAGTDPVSYGVYCVGDPGALWHPYIAGNELHGNGDGWGVYLENTDSGTIVQENDILDFSRGGVRGVGTSGWISLNAIAQSNGLIGSGTGISAETASDLIVTGNMINGFATGVSGVSTTSGGPSDLTIRNNHILNCAGDGLRFESLDTLAWDGPNVVIENNDIWGHGGYNLYLGHYRSPGARHIPAIGNWWGTTNADTVAMGIFDNADSARSPVCDYDTFLVEPIEDEAPNLWVFPSRLHAALFPNASTSKSFMIGNSGISTMDYTITEGVGETATGPKGIPVPGNGREPVTLFDVPWIDASPTEGMILGGQQEEIEVFFASTGLADSTYTAYLILGTNDPDQGAFVVPATMEVSHVFVTGPNGGETYQEENDIEVTWETAYAGDVETIDILFSSDDGRNFYPVISGAPNDGSHTWQIPGLNSDSCRVMVVARYPEEKIYYDVSDSVFSIVAPVDAGEIPAIGRATLRQNYPNPFNPSTTITFALPARTRVRLDIYAPDGRLVATLVDGERGAGIHTVLWDGVNDRGAPVSSGMYFCRMRAGERTETRKLILVR